MSKEQAYLNLNKDMKLQKIINASGKMTALGVSVISDDVSDAFKGGAQNFVNIEELYIKSGELAAKIVGAKAGLVVNSASAGIVQAIAGMIHKGVKKYIYSPIMAVQKDEIPNEIVIPKGHNVNYGGPIETMIEIAGGKIVEAGWANRCSSEDIENQITDKTAALMYVKSHHAVQKSTLTYLEMKNIAKKHNIPMIIDIAAEEEAKKYLAAGIDVIIWSGSKAISGPASGFVFSNKEYISWIYDEHLGLGRSMKTDKGIIFASLEALGTYVLNPPKIDEKILNYINENIIKNESILTKIVIDGSREDLKRVKLELTSSSKLTAFEVIDKLESGDIGIHTRKHEANNNVIYIDIRSINMEEAKILVNKINDILQGK